jgi:hypothetical protein
MFLQAVQEFFRLQLLQLHLVHTAPAAAARLHK